MLDLASHDGRFSFAALQAGAAHVVGIEHDPRLVRAAGEHLAHYGVSRDRYDFVSGDLFASMATGGPCDVVFVFGILYHVNDHMRLLTELADLDARTMIFDTNVSSQPGVVIELRAPIAGSPPPPGSQIEGWPTRAALEAMWSSFGWTYEFFDWRASGMADHPKLDDYAGGRRVTAVVTSPYAGAAAATRAEAVDAVLAADRPPDPVVHDHRSRPGVGHLPAGVAHLGSSSRALRAADGWCCVARRRCGRLNP